MAKWVSVEERQPTERGYYTIVRRRSGGLTMKQDYFWNGSYWVTTGHSPTDAVTAWLDPEGKESEEACSERSGSSSEPGC